MVWGWKGIFARWRDSVLIIDYLVFSGSLPYSWQYKKYRAGPFFDSLHGSLCHITLLRSNPIRWTQSRVYLHVHSLPRARTSWWCLPLHYQACVAACTLDSKWQHPPGFLTIGTLFIYFLVNVCWSSPVLLIPLSFQRILPGWSPFPWPLTPLSSLWIVLLSFLSRSPIRI
jgi:hypothetical protein